MRARKMVTTWKVAAVSPVVREKKQTVNKSSPTGVTFNFSPQKFQKSIYKSLDKLSAKLLTERKPGFVKKVQ